MRHPRQLGARFGHDWSRRDADTLIVHQARQRRRSRGAMYTLYSMQRSGNCYKVRLALAQLDIPYRLVEIDLLKGETRTPEFLAKNPGGRVPLLEGAPGRYLPEENPLFWAL